MVEKLRELAKDTGMSFEDVYTLYSNKYYELVKDKPDKFPGYWRNHAFTVISRQILNPPKIKKSGGKTRIIFRVESSLKDDFENKCKLEGTTLSEKLRTLMKTYISSWY